MSALEMLAHAAEAPGFEGLSPPGADPETTLAMRAAELRKRRLEDALVAFDAADGSAKSMLRPLVMLRQAGHGGQVLQVW